jgi:hypothetical protein
VRQPGVSACVFHLWFRKVSLDYLRLFCMFDVLVSCDVITLETMLLSN